MLLTHMLLCWEFSQALTHGRCHTCAAAQGRHPSEKILAQAMAIRLGSVLAHSSLGVKGCGTHDGLASSWDILPRLFAGDRLSQLWRVEGGAGPRLLEMEKGGGEQNFRNAPSGSVYSFFLQLKKKLR